MLPPVAEAVSLIDLAVVHDEWKSNPASIRRAIQILVDHVQYQSVQLSRVEDILTAYGNPTQQGGTVWSKLAGKADLSRMEKLEQQVELVLDEMAVLRSRQGESNVRQDECGSKVELLREQLLGLESKLGVAGAQGSLLGGTRQPGPTSWSEALALPSSASPMAGPSHAGSVLDRMQRLERRVEGLTTGYTAAQEEVGSVSQRFRDTESRLEAQHAQLRTDIKQALALSAASSRAEAEAEAAARVKDSERRLLARVQSVEEQVENKVAAMSGRVGTHLNAELDKRFQGLYDHIDTQVNQVKSEADRLGREKVDTSALEFYTSRVSTLFEQVAGTMGEDTRSLSTQLGENVAALRQELQLLTATKADRSAVQSLEEAMAREDEAMRTLAGQVRGMMAHIQDSLSAQPRAIEELREMLASTIQRSQDDFEHVQRSISGLNNAIASTGSAIEAAAQKTSTLSHKLSHTANELAAVKGVLFGGSATAAEGGGQSSGVDMTASTSLSGRLAALERQVGEVEPRLASKASEASLLELERRLAAVQRQADECGDGIKSLTNSTYKRVDEHASAIQRLTLAISSNLDDRPTSTVVRNMIETATSDFGERVSGSLEPLWSVVKALQGGLKDMQGAVKVAAKDVAGLTAQQADLKTRVTAERAALASLVRSTMDEELGSLARGQLEQRLVAFEEGLRNTKAQLEVQAQLQDRQHALTSSIEDQVSAQLASARAAGAALKTELTSKLDTAAAAVTQRVEVMEVVTKQQQKDLQAIREQLLQKLSGAEVKAMAQAVSKQAAKEEVARHKEREDARWQVWLEQFSETLDRLVSRGDLDAALQAAIRQTVVDATASAEAGLRDALAIIAAVRGDVEGNRRLLEERAESLGVRINRVQEDTRGMQEQLVELGAALEGKADASAVEQRLRRTEGELARKMGRAEAEESLAKKLDVRAFLANSTSVAAAAAAAAAGTSGGSGGTAWGRDGDGMGSPMRMLVGTRPAASSTAMTSAPTDPPSISFAPPSALASPADGSAQPSTSSLSALLQDADALSASMAAAARIADRVRARKAALGTQLDA